MKDKKKYQAIQNVIASVIALGIVVPMLLVWYFTFDYVVANGGIIQIFGYFLSILILILICAKIVIACFALVAMLMNFPEAIRELKEHPELKKYKVKIHF